MKGTSPRLKQLKAASALVHQPSALHQQPPAGTAAISPEALDFYVSLLLVDKLKSLEKGFDGKLKELESKFAIERAKMQGDISLLSAENRVLNETMASLYLSFTSSSSSSLMPSPIKQQMAALSSSSSSLTSTSNNAQAFGILQLREALTLLEERMLDIEINMGKPGAAPPSTSLDGSLHGRLCVVESAIRTLMDELDEGLRSVMMTSSLASSSHQQQQQQQQQQKQQQQQQQQYEEADDDDSFFTQHVHHQQNHYQLQPRPPPSSHQNQHQHQHQHSSSSAPYREPIDVYHVQLTSPKRLERVKEYVEGSGGSINFFEAKDRFSSLEKESGKIRADIKKLVEVLRRSETRLDKLEDEEATARAANRRAAAAAAAAAAASEDAGPQKVAQASSINNNSSNRGGGGSSEEEIEAALLKFETMLSQMKVIRNLEASVSELGEKTADHSGKLVSALARLDELRDLQIQAAKRFESMEAEQRRIWGGEDKRRQEEEEAAKRGKEEEERRRLEEKKQRERQEARELELVRVEEERRKQERLDAEARTRRLEIEEEQQLKMLKTAKEAARSQIEANVAQCEQKLSLATQEKARAKKEVKDWMNTYLSEHDGQEPDIAAKEANVSLFLAHKRAQQEVESLQAQLEEFKAALQHMSTSSSSSSS